MSIERREFARQRVSRVEVRVASREAFRASYLRDLSMGGLFVRSRQPLPLGTAVMVELAVEAHEPVRLRGEVARQEHATDGTPRGFGVRFDTVDAETKSALEEILRVHSEPPPALEREQLETQLSEARGTLEAYEESMAMLRQSEVEAHQQLEAAQAERDVLVQVSHELQGRVHVLEAERAELKSHVAGLSARLSKGDAELSVLHATTTRLAAELKAARAAKMNGEDAVSRLMAEFEAETERAAALKAELDAEVRALREQLEEKDETKLRAELQEFAAQLDDERLKSMALERALQRFVQMGGVIPKRTE